MVNIAQQIPLYRQTAFWQSQYKMGRTKISKGISFSPEVLRTLDKMAAELGYRGNRSQLIEDLIMSAAHSTQVVWLRGKRGATRLFVQRPQEQPPE